MAKLVDKLTTLVRAGVRGPFSGDSEHRIPRLRRASSGKSAERNIVTLREQINQALDSEDRMTENIKAMQRQIADWDQQADAALHKGDEATARHAIRQMQAQQQRLTMLQADLEHHKITTAGLISRVNELEAVAAEDERRKAQQTDSPATKKSQSRPPSARVRDDAQSAAQSATEPVAAQPAAELAELPNEQAVEDDLAQRRKRLSL